MLVLPWRIRMSIDIVIISTPFLYLNCKLFHNQAHPTTHLFEYFQNKRRIGRRLSNCFNKLDVQELGDNVNEEGFLGIE